MSSNNNNNNNNKSKLFTDPITQKPMKFWLPSLSKNRDVSELILANGGQITSTRTNEGVISLLEGDDFNKHSSDLPAYTTIYIRHCVQKQQLQPLEIYKAKSFTLKSKTHNKKKYVEEEDTQIAAFVSGLSNTSGNMIWQDMERIGVLSERNWNSMRDRYLKYILPKIATTSNKNKNTNDSNNNGDNNSNSNNNNQNQNQNHNQNVESSQQSESSKRKAPSNEEEAQQQHKIRKIWQQLQDETKLSLPVVIHALIVNSGSVKHARTYLTDGLTPNGNRWAEKGLLLWSYNEDLILYDENTPAHIDLVLRRGEQACKDRIHYLGS